MNQTLHNRLKAALETSLDQTFGAVVAVRINGKRLIETGIGYQDLNREISMPTDATFYIYSVTKSLLATAILHLVRKEILNLDAPAQYYLPELSLDPTITIRHLLSHTSGLSDYGEMPSYFNAVKTMPSIPWSRETFLDITLAQRLRFTPGTDWAYSNPGYLVLRYILERVTHLSLQQLLHQVIFAPLALQKTFVPKRVFEKTIKGVKKLSGYTL
ncbi:serine hydrolase domain-containing protein [Leptolyngbya sp. NIES-2104]|uniref:serine hydrolase domain-containing protein n=1 Tax=Leptolyngbya sp. NIES-2104 TaxID=1552121 RepID=UPI00073F9B26|nr:serine hydrolase domain-containing protein [Leptolyngbya sp. NIES-2104]